METPELLGQILVVDDDETVRRSIQKRLEKEGHRVIAVDNAMDGLKIFRSVPFDAVVSDIRMPEMNGIELLGRMQDLDRDVPVIMVTGAPSLDTAQEAVRRGAYDYITKPVQKGVFSQTVRRAVEKHHLAQRLQAYRRDLEERVREQTLVIRALLRMANELNALETLQEVLTAVVQGTYRYTQSGRVLVLLRAEEGQCLTYAHGTGVPERPVRGQSASLMEPLILKILGSRDAIRVGSQDGEPPAVGLLSHLGSFPWVAVALVHLREPFGVILASERGPAGDYTEDEIKILSYIGDSASVAIHNQRVEVRLRESYLHIAQALKLAVEAKDPYTRGHSERVRNYSVNLAKRLGLPEDEWATVGHAAILHDIGKVEISGSVLQKPGRLTDEEYASMKDHAALGEIMVEGISFLQDARSLIRHHHERWDGRGYPDGLRGAEIPLGARIIAVADVYDALTTQRPYRNDTSKERAILQLRSEKGAQLDPDLVEVFIEMIHRME